MYARAAKHARVDCGSSNYQTSQLSLRTEPLLQTSSCSLQTTVSESQLESEASGVPESQLKSEALGVPQSQVESEASGVPELELESEASGVPELQLESEASGVSLQTTMSGSLTLTPQSSQSDHNPNNRGRESDPLHHKTSPSVTVSIKIPVLLYD